MGCESLQVFVISMSEERRAPLLVELGVVPWLRVTNVAGVRANDFLDDEKYSDISAFKFLVGREMWAGELGCSLAHFNAITEFLQSESDWALILEDNARCKKDTFMQLSSLLAYLRESEPLKESPVYLQLNTSGDNGIIGRKIAEISDIILYESYRLLGPTKAYLINRKAAEIAKARSLPVRTPPDFPGWVSYVHFVVPEQEFFTVTGEFKSEIGPSRSRLVLRRDSSYIRRLARKFLIWILFPFGIEALIYRIYMKRNFYISTIIFQRIFRLTLKLKTRGNPILTYPLELDSTLLQNFKNRLIQNHGGLILRHKLK
jgi:hypothetical protein